MKKILLVTGAGRGIGAATAKLAARQGYAGRGGQAEEVAHAILWLLSDQASYTTGTRVDVAGGR